MKKLTQKNRVRRCLLAEKVIFLITKKFAVHSVTFIFVHKIPYAKSKLSNAC